MRPISLKMNGAFFPGLLFFLLGRADAGGCVQSTGPAG